MKIEAKTWTEIELDDNQIKKITGVKLRQLLRENISAKDLNKFDSFSVSKNGILKGWEDYRGDSESTEIRQATEREKAIYLILEEIKETE